MYLQRLAGRAALAWGCLLLSANVASAVTPPLSAVPGAPYATGAGPSGVAFSPSGRLLAVANNGDGTVSMFSVGAGGTLAPISGSPVQAGPHPSALAFDPSGSHLAVATDAGNGSVSVFSVGAGGALGPVGGSPFPTGVYPDGVAYSPSGGMLAVTNQNGGTVSEYVVTGGGALQQAGGSPFTVGHDPAGLAFSPSGNQLAVALLDPAAVALFNVGNGYLQPVAGSPFQTGASYTSSVAWAPSGGLLAASNANVGGGPSVFSTTPSGGLALAAGSPYTANGGVGDAVFGPSGGVLATTGSGLQVFAVGADGSLSQLDSLFAGSSPSVLAFSPSGGLIAVTDNSDNTVWVFSVAAPSAQITAPAPGATFVVGQHVATAFDCADSPAGPGIASCDDAGGASAPTGVLSTVTPGSYVYTVTATSKDGQSFAASVPYTVVAPPSISRLHLGRRAFRPAARGGPLRRKGSKRGVTITLRSSLPARLVFTISRIAPGVRRRDRCVAPGRRRHGRRCTRMLRAGSFTYEARAGLDRLSFTGRLDRRALPVGSYVLTAQVQFAGAPERALSARFRVLP